ncbi:Guanine nucleotide binding protein (G-protein) [Macleaya cordata]|uniref:Guanine nucleotide binding protein (G-protein) n=1 Tax=Macleaya cordata TaxID=56857 RepID=A0A200R7C6_MACCD|nr:Guanine nucleotide binding protein (G-protein) [Macleaya cordata]
MKGLISRMLPVGAPIPDNEDEMDYSFAMEYHGPPVTYDLPRAVPIDIKRIPTASVVAPTSLSDKLSLPVVQPLLIPDSLNKEHSKEELNLSSDSIVSPTSVIAFEHRGTDGHDCGLSSEFSSLGTTSGFSNSHDQSCELSDLVDNSGVLGFSDGHECSGELSHTGSSSGSLGICNSKSQSGEIGISEALGCSKDCKESVDFLNDTDPQDWVSSESPLSSQFLSSAASSFKAEDCSNLPPSHGKRTAVVTFRDVESGDIVQEEFSDPEAEIVPERKEPETKVKKGLCYRCLKGNRFTEKEVCIVCNAKYCSNCVLRAMGSMPEGRKCVTCIGFPIDESKRKGLGKCSRMLKRLLSELEIRQIMEAEKLCEANQLQAEHVYVNGEQLCQDELVLLQSCPNPPTKLKPGRYWYDKVSGFWGKEGQKPCKIISAHLNVGGPLMENASNGNTLVFINNREITKVELRMLQLAGVQCAGNPHFWVDEDGSYQEEGQKNIKGNLWSKAGIKLVCAVLSLPVPYKAAIPSGEEINNSVGGVVPDYRKGMLQKLLLVGYDGSGTSTIFKQAKILYKSEPFSEDERQNIKLTIQSNIYYYLGILLEGRERFEEEILSERRRNRLLDQSDGTGSPDKGDDKTIYSIGPRLKAFSDWLLKVMVSGNLEAIFPAATREYAPLVEELWKDAAIQATFNRRSELQMLPSVASYFLEQVVNISRTDYEPSNVDALYAEGITSSNGLACMDFSFPQSSQDCSIDASNQHEPLLRYQLIRVHTRGLGENCKWLEMFEDVGIAIFCVSLSDYDQFCDEGSGALTNKMVASRRLFESIVTHPVFEEMDFLLILNKFDLLEEKIERVPLTQCEWFNDFHPVTSRNRPNSDSSNINSGSSLAQLAFHYIAVKFKRHFTSLTGRKLYVSMVNGLESDTVDEALRYSREILKWDEERANFSASEYSIYSTEASSSS